MILKSTVNKPAAIVVGLFVAAGLGSFLYTEHFHPSPENMTDEQWTQEVLRRLDQPTPPDRGPSFSDLQAQRTKVLEAALREDGFSVREAKSTGWGSRLLILDSSECPRLHRPMRFQKVTFAAYWNRIECRNGYRTVWEFETGGG